MRLSDLVHIHVLDPQRLLDTSSENANWLLAHAYMATAGPLDTQHSNNYNLEQEKLGPVSCAFWTLTTK